MTIIGIIAGLTICCITVCTFQITYISYEHQTTLNLICALEREQMLTAVRAFVTHLVSHTQKPQRGYEWCNEEWLFKTEVTKNTLGSWNVLNKIIFNGVCIGSEAYILSL